MSEPRWSELASAYVLGALDPEESVAFEERLEKDAELRAEVDLQREVVVALGEAVPRRTPPPSLKARIMDEARGAQPTPSVPSTGERGATSRREGRPEKPGQSRAMLPWLAAAAGLVAAVGLGVVAQRLESSRAALENRLRTVESELVTTTTRLAERDSLLATFLGPDVRTAVLSATGQPPSARLFWNTETSTLMVAAFDLPPAPAGRIYQLWGIPAGENPVSLGTFQTAADGTVLVQRTAPVGADFEVGAVTEEPAGGSQQPTSTPFLVGTWAGG